MRCVEIENKVPVDLIRRTGGGWLAVSGRGAVFKIGVTGPTEEETRERFKVSYCRWQEIYETGTVERDMSDTEFTKITGPGVDKLDALKDSQGQPLSSGDITYDRILAVARSVQRMVQVQEYLLNRAKLTGEVPHREHQQLYEMRQKLNDVRQTLDVFFFGD